MPALLVKRYVILASSFLMQMCLGATYSWSVFVRPIREATGLSQGLAQIPFTTFYFAFPVTFLLAAPVVTALGPRRSALLGTLLFGAGWAVAGLGGPTSFGFVILGVGLLAGIGVGIAYIVPITVSNRWFPEIPGLVTGIAVAGFAVGAALVGLTGEGMMLEGGTGPFRALALLGLGFLVLGVPAAAQMRFPDETAVAPAASLRRVELARTVEFRQLFPAMVAGLAAGFAVNTNLKDLGSAGGLAAGATAVSVFAVANAAGRIAWGWVFDRMLPSSAIRLNLFLQAAVLSGVYVLVEDGASLLVFAALAGFNYGGILVLYASTVARRWGLMHVGQVYGLLFTANIVASPAPMAAGFSLDLFGSFAPAFLVFAVLAAGAALLVGSPVNRKAADPGGFTAGNSSMQKAGLQFDGRGPR